MKVHLITIYIGVISLVLGLIGCTDGEIESITGRSDIITFNINHPATMQTRATDTGFEAGDQVGVFLTVSGQAVEIAGNYATNLPLSYDGTKWSSSYTLYWDDRQYDAIAYYPYTSPLSSISDLPFSVQTEQNSPATYTASDFLWAQEKGTTGSDGGITLQFTHRMSRLLVRLVKGEEYEGDLPEDAEVYIHNTVTDATIDLNAGIATRVSHASAQTIHARPLGNHRYAAIIVPQRLDNRLPLIEVVTKGISYLYEGKFLFKPGTQHNVLLVLMKNAHQVKIQLGGETENWNE